MAQSNQEHLNYVSASFQMVLIAATSCILALLLYWPYLTFTPLEKPPSITSFTPQKLLEFGSPAEVRTGMYIKDFVSVDIINGSMTVDALVWFIYDPESVSFERISKFGFSNGTITQPDDFEKRQQRASVSIYDASHMLAEFNIRADFRMPLQFDLFPIDDHITPFIMTNEYASPRQMVFHAVRRDFIVEPGLQAFGWKQHDTDVRTGYREYVFDEEGESKTFTPQTVFSINYRRIGIRHILSIFLPLLLIFFVSLFAFSFDIEGPHAGQAFGFAAGGITAMVTYYYVIQSMSPSVSYFMISDYLYFLFLLLNFLVFLIIVFKTKITAWQKRLILVLLHTLVISSAVYLFIFWLR